MTFQAINPSIPASFTVSVQPQTLLAGGTGLALNGMFLTASTQVPIGTVAQFGSALDVSTYFGPNSTEYKASSVYFAGFEGSNIKPAALLFTQYNAAAVGAYLRGAPVTGLSIAQLGELSGSLTILIDGYTHTAASCNLSGCTSYSNAASIIATALFASEPSEATSSAATCAGTVLTVGGTVTGTFAVGQTVTGSSITDASVITSLGTGSGGAGTYNLSQSSTVGSPEAIVASATVGTVTFDGVSGGFVIASGITGTPSTIAFATGTLAPSIFLQSAQGAVLSQGAAAAVPASFMTALTNYTQNWASFTTLFDPDNGSGNTVKLAFATWNGLQNSRWVYVCWDPDPNPATTVPATSSLGYLIAQSAIAGTALIWEPTAQHYAAFLCGAIASVDFTELGGRVTFKFRQQSGLTPNVTSLTQALNLIANGYNYYGSNATAAAGFIWFGPGSISGGFTWLDSYINQIWLNNALQLDLILLLTQSKSIPYNQSGYNQITASVTDTLQQALSFGAINTGVVLSSAQIAAVNAGAGTTISNTLFTSGYYFQVLPAAASVRAVRGSPPCTLWYMDGGAVQQINLASIDVQ